MFLFGSRSFDDYEVTAISHRTEEPEYHDCPATYDAELQELEFEDGFPEDLKAYATRIITEYHDNDGEDWEDD